jgi:hypothetical protein
MTGVGSIEAARLSVLGSIHLPIIECYVRLDPICLLTQNGIGLYPLIYSFIYSMRSASKGGLLPLSESKRRESPLRATLLGSIV